MFKIRLVKDIRTDKGWISAGEELEARILPGGNPFDIGRPYQVIEGKYSGIEILQTHAITIPKEKLYTEQQYKTLTNELQQVRQELKVSKGRNSLLEVRLEERRRAAVGWEKSWEKQRKMNQQLQQELKTVAISEKVILPQDVANAIEKCRGVEMSDYGIITLSVNPKNLCRDYPSEVIDALYVIKQYTYTYSSEDFESDTGADKLLKALVHGYTVELSLQDRIKQGVQAIYEEWTTIPTSGNDQADGVDLAERISTFVTSEMKL
ncbi:hypothetical protein P9G84_31845 [Brevibacillus centrosporus]|uniref:hypothetical protein n=1 Tax=Brevibacillus centrosporus TaxID=54910 RepID=UPI000F09AE56|nr:hypothetical protein [Brevibacillus centrosporus]MEC2133445.1 hypothetical protein [Brevibacillus centrosporus]RNB63162.1 hypothetical protein EDM55_29305 [Brevibacillus centrosporus]